MKRSAAIWAGSSSSHQLHCQVLTKITVASHHIVGIVWQVTQAVYNFCSHVAHLGRSASEYIWWNIVWVLSFTIPDQLNCRANLVDETGINNRSSALGNRLSPVFKGAVSQS